MSRRVVVTGMGIWSCIGQNVAEVTESLRAGRSGIGVDEKRKEYGYRSSLTGIVPRPDLKPYLDRRMRNSLADETEYAYMAAREAFAMAGMDSDYLAANETGILFGNDSTGKAVVQTAKRMEEMKDSMLIGAGAIFQTMNSTVTMNLSTIFRLRGINFTISAACSSGAHSIGMAYLLIKQGLQDIVLAGGAQEVNEVAMASFDGLGAFSTRMDAPQQASRPFDRNRDGLVPSGGAAALVIEEYEHAVARGANILAEITGYGFSSNGLAISQPAAEGSVRAMKRALADAGLTPQDIDYVNAHATSTLPGDRAEAEALTELFAGTKALVSSTKSMTGHECWMAGASEAVYSILMMRNGFAAPNINLEEPDEAAARLNIVRQTVSLPINTVLSNSYGFRGTNSEIILQKI
ncbi:MAG: beta-ketoacyl-[acyl-carrier-protein] synthase family protein [Paludibacteraceae bacterium]|nr:beta-ketoacyl-[acyl-carrier-protein] synthase family protein [Paludibacteraceae bacterium]